MNRYFVYLMVFVAAMLIAMPVLADNVYTGRVMSAGSGQIMIMEPSGEMRMFSVGSEARILHDGKAAVLDDIDDGDVAKDRKSTRLNSSHIPLSRMPSSA